MITDEETFKSVVDGQSVSYEVYSDLLYEYFKMKTEHKKELEALGNLTRTLMRQSEVYREQIKDLTDLLLQMNKEEK